MTICEALFAMRLLYMGSVITHRVSEAASLPPPRRPEAKMQASSCSVETAQITICSNTGREWQCAFFVFGNTQLSLFQLLCPTCHERGLRVRSTMSNLVYEIVYKEEKRSM